MAIGFNGGTSAMCKRSFFFLALTIALATSACGRDLDPIAGMQFDWDPSKYKSPVVPRPGAGLTDSGDSLATLVDGPYGQCMGLTSGPVHLEGCYTIQGPDGKTELRSWKHANSDGTGTAQTPSP